MANKKDLAENRQDLLQIGILSLWVQYSTRNMGLPSAKRKSDKTQIGLFIGGEVFHFGGDYDIIKTKISTNKSVQCVEKRCLSLIEYVGVDKRFSKVYLKTKKMTDISQTQAGFCVCRNRRYFRRFRYTLIIQRMKVIRWAAHRVNGIGRTMRPCKNFFDSLKLRYFLYFICSGLCWPCSEQGR